MFYNAQAYPQSGWHFGPARGAGPQQRAARRGRRPGSASRSSRPATPSTGTRPRTRRRARWPPGKDYPLDYKLGDMQRRSSWRSARAACSARSPRSAPRCSTRASRRATARTPTSPRPRSGRWSPACRAGPSSTRARCWRRSSTGRARAPAARRGIIYDAVTIKYHMIPFRAAMEAGAVNIMPGYAGSSFLDPGGPGAGDSAQILAYLRQQPRLHRPHHDRLAAVRRRGSARRTPAPTSWAAPTRARPASRSPASLSQRAARPDQRRGDPGPAAEVPARASSRTRTATRSTARTGSTSRPTPRWPTRPRASP